MTKEQLVADLEKQDISVDDWLDIWLDETHKDEPLLTPYIRGYLAGKLDEISNSLSSDSEDYRDEVAEILDYMLEGE